MANIIDRWMTTDRETGEKVKSERYGKGQRYRARYRDEHGRDHTRAFAKKADATKWIATETAAIVTGEWVNPGAGQITFRQWWDQWTDSQEWVSGTAESAQQVIDSVTFADVPIKQVNENHVRQWMKSLRLPGPKRKSGLGRPRVAPGSTTYGCASHRPSAPA